MKFEGLDDITVADLREIYRLKKLSVTDAMPIMRQFRDKHGLTDREALNAFNLAKMIFEA